MFARTDRLLLRPGFIEDAPALAAAIADPAIVAGLTRVPWPYGLDEARDFLARDAEPLFPRFLVFARTASAPRLIGGVDLSRDRLGHRNLGYWIVRDMWGQGYATEAARAVCAIADAAGLGPIHAAHFADNAASGAVLRKAGFAPTGSCARERSALGVEGCAVGYHRPLGGAASWHKTPLRRYCDNAQLANGHWFQ